MVEIQKKVQMAMTSECTIISAKNVFRFLLFLALIIESCNTWHYSREVFNALHVKQLSIVQQKLSYSSLYATENRKKNPNIVLILTDDQDIELGSLNFMPNTLKRIRDEGAELRHAYVTTPMCCPSRSSLLTGRYVHNHQVFTNNDNCSSFEWQRDNEPYTFATYLSTAGYRTGYFGKYLNKYNGSYIPPGWREWGGLIMNSRYYNYSININGKKIRHGFDYSKDYYPDLIANDSVTFVRQSKINFSQKPFMLVASFPAPHGPEDSAPQYSKLFFNVTAHHTPAYDYAPNLDKQWILQVTQKMEPIHKQFTNLLMTKRLQTLQSVDAAVEKIYQELQSIGELENTYIVYTSDHGYHLGQFGLVKGKSFPFEFDIRVPFLIRGPGIESGSIIDEIVLNIDLAPTFLDIAGVEIPSRMDGRSFKKLFLNNKIGLRIKQQWPDTFLIESSGRREMTALQVTSISNYKKLHERQYVKINRFTSDNGKKWESELINNQANLSHINQNKLYLKGNTNQSQKILKNNSSWELCKHRQSLHQYKCQPHWKKCACFTPTGVVYMRIRIQHATEQHNFRSNKVQYSSYKDKRRIQRKNVSKRIDLKTMHRPIFLPSNIIDVFFHQQHTCRNIHPNKDSNYVAETIENIEKKLNQLTVKQSNTDENSGTKCNLFGINVICTLPIHRDLIHWQVLKNRVEQRIRILRIQLDILKDIRRQFIRICSYKSSHKDNTCYSDRYSYWHKQNQYATRQVFEVNFGVTVNSQQRITSNDRSDSDKKIMLFIVPINKYINEDQFLEKFNDTKKRWKNTSQHIKSTNFNFRRSRLQQNTTSSYKSVPFFFFSKYKNTTKKQLYEKSVTTANLGIARVINVEKNRRFSKTLDSIARRQRRNYKCFCESNSQTYSDSQGSKLSNNEQMQKVKYERLRGKERELRRKFKLQKKCLMEKMNCFEHDNNHWRTAPFWNAGSFCFCMNANNNTYSCIRTINVTHNFLYCEFTTGLITYYNLRIDPFEQWNRAFLLNDLEKSYLHGQLEHLKRCKGTKDCTLDTPRNLIKDSIFISQQHKITKQNNFDNLHDTEESESR